MKRIILLILALMVVAALAFSACAQNVDTEEVIDTTEETKSIV